MSRTRLVQNTRPVTETILDDFGTASFFTLYLDDEFRKITDENNKTKRPWSLVQHLYCTLSRIQGYEYYEPPLFGSGYHHYDVVVNRTAGVIANYVDGLVQTIAGDLLKSFERQIYVQYAQIFDRFSILNPLAEFKELGDLGKQLGKKALSLAEFKRAGSEVNYLDYKFGVEPMLRDMVDFSERIKTTQESISSKLEAMSKPIKISKSKSVAFDIPGDIGFHINDSSRFQGNGKITVRIKGTINIVPPALRDFDRDWFIWLDRVGFKPDLATIWEAIPFSWFADWFVPIGSTLEAFSGNWYSPKVYLDCKASVKWEYSGNLITARTNGSVYRQIALNDKPSHVIRELGGYRRFPVMSEFSSMSLSRPEVEIPTFNVGRSLILLSIADIDEGKKKKLNKLVKSEIRRQKRNLQGKRNLSR